MPPADTFDSSQHIANAVRSFNAVIAAVVSENALRAARNGDASSAVDPQLFSSAWEGVSVFRDQMILCLARSVRNEWRRDVAEIVANTSAERQAEEIASILDLRLQCVLDFAFRFLVARQICLLADALVLAFEVDMAVAVFSKELAKVGSASKLATRDLLNALVLGVSEMYRYQPERVLSIGR